MPHKAALILGLLLASATANAQNSPPSGTVGLSNFFDRPVVSSDGTQVGLTKHVAINVKDGDVPFLAVGEGNVLSLVPLSALSGDGGNAPYRLAMSRAEFARAPQWPADRLAAMNHPNFIGALSDHYRRPISVTTDSVAAAGEGTPLRFIGIAPPGAPVENFAGRERLWGDQVALASGHLAGPISDLRVNLPSSKLVEVAVNLPDRRVTMPFTSLKWTRERQAFISPLTDTQLASLTTADWSRSAAPQPAPAQTAEVRPSRALMFDPTQPGPRFW